MIIPIGCFHKIREAIDKYFKSKTEQGLFDCCISNFDSVLYLLKNIDNKFISNEIYDTGQLDNTKLYRIINHKKTRLSFIQDFPINKTYESYLPIFTEKMNTYLKKFKNDIKIGLKIHFIHLLDFDENIDFVNNPIHKGSKLYIPSNTMLNNFIAMIKEINPTLVFNIHLLVHPDYIDNSKDILDNLKCTSLKIHYLKKNFDTLNFTYDFNWNDVFNNLDNNIIQFTNIIPASNTTYNLPIQLSTQQNIQKEMLQKKLPIYTSPLLQEEQQKDIHNIQTYDIDLTTLPDDFDVNIYKFLYKDLQNLSDEKAKQHYIEYGKNENRIYKINEKDEEINIRKILSTNTKTDIINNNIKNIKNNNEINLSKNNINDYKLNNNDKIFTMDTDIKVNTLNNNINVQSKNTDKIINILNNNNNKIETPNIDTKVNTLNNINNIDNINNNKILSINTDKIFTELLNNDIKNNLINNKNIPNIIKHKIIKNNLNINDIMLLQNIEKKMNNNILTSMSSTSSTETSTITNQDNSKNDYILPKDFKTNIYKSIHKDLENLTDEELIYHYIYHGRHENRPYNINSDFNVKVYKRIYKDLSELSDQDATMHYLKCGIKEGRLYKYDDVFRPALYKSLNKDLKDLTDQEATLHFYRYGIDENRPII